MNPGLNIQHPVEKGLFSADVFLFRMLDGCCCCCEERLFFFLPPCLCTTTTVNKKCLTDWEKSVINPEGATSSYTPTEEKKKKEPDIKRITTRSSVVWAMKGKKAMFFQNAAISRRASSSSICSPVHPDAADRRTKSARPVEKWMDMLVFRRVNRLVKKKRCRRGKNFLCEMCEPVASAGEPLSRDKWGSFILMHLNPLFGGTQLQVGRVYIKLGCIIK